MPTKIEKDAVSGTETTGHEWDGIKELNTPLPSWWVYVFWATVIWSIGYWVVYPSFPSANGYFAGLFETTNRKELIADMAEAKAEKAVFLDRIAAMNVADIKDDPQLLAFSMAGAKAAFGENCAACHGTGGAGGPGYPSLIDDDWLWGGDVETIEETIRVGIRADNDDTRSSEMPAFGADELLDRDEVNDVVNFVMSLSGRAEDPAAAARGAMVFEESCASCHGADAKGDRDFGAPNLTDGIWLYGGDKAAITETVMFSRKGVMPAWQGRLDDEAIKMIAVYVNALGGGE